ncbi:MAG TPA: FAD-dependent oxidoreductase [Chitinophagaceae bacterium]|jgi:glycine/D-amino acid oxidase-like deaminating enzyme/nitrite reductase/ring-hydroxylating ferredoxin subunit|nr:FAD-dependent oxidoreductase [Chitinophagaceae bacterium]
MKRDGACTSLWQANMPDYKAEKATPAANQYFDVVIVGAGITGITTGLLLQKAGRSVMIAEAQNIGFGTTGGTTAHLNSFMETPFTTLIKNFGEENAVLVAKAARQALELIKKHVDEYSIDCGYKEVQGYIYAQNEEQIEELNELSEGFQKVGINVSASNTIPVKIPFQKAIGIPGQAQFHPTRYIYALAKEFEKLGGVLTINCRVTGVEENEVLEVSTSQGNFKAKNLIYATHIPPGVNLLHFRCAPYRSYVIAVKLKNEEDYPEGLAYDMDDPYRYFRTQEIDGQKYLIAGGEDHKTAHEENTEGCFTRLETYVRKFYEIDSIAFRWSSQYYDPVDGLAYIGHLPGHQQNMFVATGYGGIGMTNSHIAAVLLTDLIVSGKNEFSHLFDPNRLKPVAGFSKFVKEAADVVGHLIGGIFSREKLESLVELAPGEAKVVVYEGHKLALYKDDEGHLHALHSACTHIKCTVSWNGAEKSWDCPCHGARFSCEGTMLNGPARKDLAPIKLEELVEQ